MTPMLFKFPFDKTGRAINNQVNRPVDLSDLVDKPNRCFCLDEGYFFKEGLEIVEQGGRPLKEHIDYKTTGADRDLMKVTGKEVVCVIVIINSKVASQLRVSCQLVGGRQGHPANEIAILANQVLNSKREVLWNNVKQRPDAVRASGHLHAMWELFAFELFNEKLVLIQRGIKAKSQKRYGEIRDQFQEKMDGLIQRLAVEKERLAAHVANQDDPHRLTALQVVLNQVNNYGVATQQEASQPGTSVQNRYMTVEGGARSIQVNYLDRLQVHIDNQNNPHGDTAAKAGTLSYEESDAIFNTKYLLNETVVNSAKFDGRSFQQVYNAVRQNLTIPMLSTLGRVAPQRLGDAGGVYDDSKVLAGDKTFKDIAQLFKMNIAPAAKIVYLSGSYTFDSAAATLNSAFSDPVTYPENTLAFFMVYRSTGAYNGNGTTTTTTYGINVAVKRGGTWLY